MKILKVLLVLGLGVWGFFGALELQKLWILNGADLVFHEVGHPLFGIFGKSIGIWGGTLMQLLIPLVIMISFLRRGRQYSAAVILFLDWAKFFPYRKLRERCKNATASFSRRRHS